MSRQQYLNSIKQGAIQGWHEHKILPSITGAQAALESGWGSSKLSKPPYNNNFGIKASADWTGQKIAMQTQEFVNGRTITTTADFRVYSSIGESIKDHGAFFTNTPWRVNNYRNVVGERDYKRAAQALQASGYATDPNYASKILNIIEGNNLVSWDKEAFAGNTVTNLIENQSNKNEKVVGGSLTNAAQNDTEDHTLTVIGDSLGVGTEPHLKKYTWAKANYDNYGSRQWTHTTAVYNAMGVLQNMAAAGTLNKNVVFILGTNRGVTSEEINQAVGICGRDRNIILVDTASEVNHKNTVSKMYKQASQQHDNVYYANWSEKARPNMSKYYHNDGANGTRIHMTSEGYKAHAEFIVQAIYQANATNWNQAINVVTPKDKDYVDIFEIDYNDDKFTSPQGDSSIYNVELNNQFGFKPKKGQVMWIERVYEGSEDNTSDLLANAIKYMEEHSLPGVQYTVSMRYLPDDISIGDTGLFIDHDFNPPLYIKARVLSISTSESNPSSDSVVIGNVVELFPTDKSDLLSIQRELQETREDLISEYFDTKPIRVEISSTNGLSFGARTSTAGYNLVKDASRSISIVDGQAIIDIAKVKNSTAKFKLHGKIENNYIDSVDELANEIQADKEEIFTGPIDEDSNPQGEAEPNPLDNIDIRQLKVNNFDIQFLNSTGNTLYQRNIEVYEDSTFLHELDNINPDVAKIKITASRDFKFESINLIEPEIAKDKDIHKTKLEAKVYVEDEEITHNYNSYSWVRISNNPRLDESWNDKNKWNQTNKIDISLEDIDSETASFLCKVFDEKGEFVTANSVSITIAQEGNKNTISGPDAPPSDPYPGDKWTIIDGDIEEERHYIDGEWQKTGVSKKVDTALAEAEQAKKDATNKANQALADAKAHADAEDTRIKQEIKLEVDGAIEIAEQAKVDVVTKANKAYEDAVIEADRLAGIRDNGITIDAGQITAGVIDTARLDAKLIVTSGLTTNIIKSTHIETSTATIDKLFANETMINKLTSKTAFINSIKAVEIDAGKITSGSISTARLDASDIVTKGLTADVVTSTHIKADTTLIDNIFGTKALIEQLTSKTAFISSIKAISIDVDKITGDTADFISAGFKSLNSQATINGHAIRIQNTAGEFVEMNNTPELRSDDAGGTAVVLGKGRVQFYDSRGHAKGYVGTDMYTAGNYDFGTFLSKGAGIYRFARMADAAETTYAYYTVKSGMTNRVAIIEDMVRRGLLPDGNAEQFVAKSNMIAGLNGWPYLPQEWPTLTVGQQIRYKELTTQTTGDVYEDIWKFGPSSAGDWRVYFLKHARFEGGFTDVSDRRIKHDILPTTIEALSEIEKFYFKEYKMNSDGRHVDLGLIAQEAGILRVADDELEGIDIQKGIMLGLKGVQELHAIVKEQAEEIKQLKEIINQ